MRLATFAGQRKKSRGVINDRATKGNQMSRIQAAIEFDRSKAKLSNKALSQSQYRAAVAESDAAWRILQQAANESGQ
jgi:hypothetical protein